VSAAVAFVDEPLRHRGWVPITEQAPQLSMTVWAYLDQMALSLRPASITAADTALRGLAGLLIERDVTRFADVARADVEAFKTWLAVTPTIHGTVPSRNTIRQRLGIVRSFFDRIIEWGWVDAPARTPMFAIDVPVADDPLPRFLDDAQAARLTAAATRAEPLDRLVVELFEREGRSLVRMARLFVDDRNAAEDLVQEAFIRLARSANRIQDESKAAAYLRSIVLNLARDHNRRGLVSLRQHLPFDEARASFEDEIVLRDDHRVVIDALRDLPHRQRDCLVLRYYQELGVDDIAETLGISRNSVKTHLKRGLVAMESRVSAAEPLEDLS